MPNASLYSTVIKALYQLDTVLLQIFARVKILRFSQFEPNFNILRSYFCDRGYYPQKLVYR